MSEAAKLRGTNSPLTLLKELWLSGFFVESRDYWREQFGSRRTQSEIREEIYQKYNVHLQYDKQLTRFRQWVEDQDQRDEEIEAMNEDLRRTNGMCTNATVAEIRDTVYQTYHMRALARGDVKLGKFILRMDLADRKLALRQRKARLAEEEEASRALDFCIEEARKYPEVEKLFREAFAGLRKAKTVNREQETPKTE
ncbi:MAG TPA: hypothetical protein VGI03_06185 [Verrucomicrobiae bacterium]|jgi:hypothetical protein